MFCRYLYPYELYISGKEYTSSIQVISASKNTDKPVDKRQEHKENVHQQFSQDSDHSKNKDGNSCTLLVLENAGFLPNLLILSKTDAFGLIL